MNYLLDFGTRNKQKKTSTSKYIGMFWFLKKCIQGYRSGFGPKIFKSLVVVKSIPKSVYFPVPALWILIINQKVRRYRLGYVLIEGN